MGSKIFNEVVSELWIFSVIFLIFYFPVSVLIGRWHTNTQLSVDVTMKMNQEPIIAQMIRTLLDVQTGRATKKETEEFRKMILKIERGDIHEL